MSLEFYSKQDGYTIWRSKTTEMFYVHYDDEVGSEVKGYGCAALAIAEAERVMTSKS